MRPIRSWSRWRSGLDVAAVLECLKVGVESEDVPTPLCVKGGGATPELRSGDGFVSSDSSVAFFPRSERATMSLVLMRC